jgi:quercetin dioxygenase-like cupin family protein
MTAIKFVHGSERRFVSVHERAKAEPQLAEILKRYPPGEMEGETFIHHAGSSDEPQLLEVKLSADTQIAAHAHDADEIIVVVEGEVHFGKQRYGIGSSVLIPRMTLYSFRAGPAGLTFLNFRPRKSTGTISKGEFMAMRAEADRSST